MNKFNFYQVYTVVPMRFGGFIWYPYKIFKSKSYAIKVMKTKVSCFAIAMNPYGFCEDSKKKLFVYGNYKIYNGLTLDRFADYKKIYFV